MILFLWYVIDLKPKLIILYEYIWMVNLPSYNIYLSKKKVVRVDLNFFIMCVLVIEFIENQSL